MSQLARRKVTVALSGDGGDELFGGYHRYQYVQSIWRRMKPLPRPLRASLGSVAGAVPQGAWDSVFRAASPLLPRRLRHRLPGQKVHKLAMMAGARDGDEVYRSLVSAWSDPNEVVIDGHESGAVITDATRRAELPDLLRRMMYADLVTYLVDDILTKVDRASMGVSLEARVPLLDHRIVEFAWRLPTAFKIRDGQGKYPLRRVLERHVPRDLFERPKMGFGAPIEEWLRGPLRDWAESLLSQDRLTREGFLRPAPIRQEWERVQRGIGNHNRIWAVLMFQAWVERHRPTG